MEESSAFPGLSAVYFLWDGGQGRWLVCREGLMRGVSGLMGKENETVFGQTDDLARWSFRSIRPLLWHTMEIPANRTPDLRNRNQIRNSSSLIQWRVELFVELPLDY